MSDEARSFYCGFLYNWETRAKTWLTWQDITPESYAEMTQQPGACLYLLDCTLEPPRSSDEPPRRVWCRLVRHDNPKPLQAHQTLHGHLLSHLDAWIGQSMPKGTYGPDIGPYCGKLVSREKDKSVSAFSVPGHYFKLTIEEVQREEYDALKSDFAPPAV